MLQTAVLHVQSAQRQDAEVGDLLAALLQQPKSYAAQLLAEHGVTRLDILEYISHGIAKKPMAASPESAGPAPPAGPATKGPRRRRTRFPPTA